MPMCVSNLNEIVIAVVSNPSFFIQTAQPEVKIKQVCDFIKAVNEIITK